MQAANDTLKGFGTTYEENEKLLTSFDTMLQEMKKPDDVHYFDFFRLLFGEDKHDSRRDWSLHLRWYQIIPFKWIKRNWFKEELYWMEDPDCSGYEVDSNPKCDLRPKELQLLAYTPLACLDDTTDGCDRLVSYVRLTQRESVQMQAMLQFMTTIFTCLILGAGAIMFSNDTEELIINPITKMVSIIKTLAENPLDKPEPPQFDDDEGQEKE